jgi:hypothetical protein
MATSKKAEVEYIDGIVLPGRSVGPSVNLFSPLIQTGKVTQHRDAEQYLTKVVSATIAGSGASKALEARGSLATGSDQAAVIVQARVRAYLKVRHLHYPEDPTH